MINQTRASIQSTKLRADWIPPKIGIGLEYVCLLFISALLCITCVYWSTSLIVPDRELPFIVASMGAAAVLMFASPASPMASSWAFVIGNLSSALVGMTIFMLFGNNPVSAGTAVATAIMVMHVTHSMHPPGGATALFAVVGGSLVEELGYFYVAAPVGVNLAVFFIFVRINRLYQTNRQQRFHNINRLHDAIFKHSADSYDHGNSAFIKDDIDQALALLGGNPDVSTDYLKQVVENTLAHAQIRKLEEIGYHTLQINPPILEFGDSLIGAWELLHREHANVIVVLHPGGKFFGILTFEDFISLIKTHDPNKPHTLENTKKLTTEIEHALLPSGLLEDSRPEVCGQLAHTVPQLTDLGNAGNLMINGSSEYAALINSTGIFQCLLKKNHREL